MEIRNKINEKHFNLEIYEWDDLTLDILKAYSDWKCNGNQASKTTLVTIGKQPEKEPEKNVKINVNKPIEPEKTKEETKIKHGNFNTLFSNENKLTEPGDYGTTALYKPILDYILENTTDTFPKKDIIYNLCKFYKQKGWPLKESSARIYETQYRRYMLDKKIIHSKDFDSFTKIKKNPTIKNIH